VSTLFEKIRIVRKQDFRYIDTEGPRTFLEIEESTILSRHFANAVVATGGSVVFRTRAMEQLKNSGVVIYLKISFEEMEKRLRNITTRGIVLIADQNLRDMYDQRVPLYEKYADRTIDCSDEDFETVVAKVIDEQ
jgi:shikimate kinase